MCMRGMTRTLCVSPKSPTTLPFLSRRTMHHETVDGLDPTPSLVRFPLTEAVVPRKASHQDGPSPRPNAADRPLFCLHPRTIPSPAGCVCCDCGVVLVSSPEVQPPTGARRLPVVVEETGTDTQPHSAALVEWQSHTRSSGRPAPGAGRSLHPGPAPRGHGHCAAGVSCEGPCCLGPSAGASLQPASTFGEQGACSVVFFFPPPPCPFPITPTK